MHMHARTYAHVHAYTYTHTLTRARACSLSPTHSGDYTFPSPYWDGISDAAKDLVSQLLTVDPVFMCSLKTPVIGDIGIECVLYRDAAKDLVAQLLTLDPVSIENTFYTNLTC